LFLQPLISLHWGSSLDQRLLVNATHLSYDDQSPVCILNQAIKKAEYYLSLGNACKINVSPLLSTRHWQHLALLLSLLNSRYPCQLPSPST
jgi:hypothetical protein